MPPRKKIVKKAVRKAKSKAQTPPPLSDEPESVPESSVPAADDAGATVASATDADTSVLGAVEPATDAPTAEETAAFEPISNEILEPQQPDANTEILGPEPAAVDESLADEPAAIEPAGSGEALVEEPENTEILGAEPTAGEASEEPSEAAKKKTVARVRKVVKKKIVKKLVPKTAAATEEESKVEEEEEAAAAEEEAGKKAEAQQPGEKQREVENLSSGDAPAPMETAVGTEDAGQEDAEQTEGAENAEHVEKAEDGLKAEEKEHGLEMKLAGDELAAIPESSSSRKKTEIFIGGLDRDAKEEDLRKVFGEVGEIVEVRMIMDGQSGKNKGYAFLRYAEASQAKKAVAQFEKVEVCGKLCGASALKGNDTIFLGNIDKKWKKEDIIKLLQEIGIEKIEAVTVMPDSNNADSNRGFAFVELETNKDAQNAYKKLQKKDAFGKGRNIKVAWAEPLNDPDEEQMKKVKSVYAEGIPASWDEEKVREFFKKFGEIERVVLARNIKSSKRKDFAFVNYETRDAALSCIETFDEELIENGSKINVKVSLAKPVQKGKQNKGGSKSTSMNSFKEKSKAVQRDTKASITTTKGQSFREVFSGSSDMRSSTNHELLHVLRGQATWQQGQIGYPRGPAVRDHAHGVERKRRPFSSLGGEAFYSDTRGYPRARLDSFHPTGSSYGAMPTGAAGPSHPYYQHQGVGYAAGAPYGPIDYSAANQMRQGAPPHGSSYYSRY